MLILHARIALPSYPAPAIANKRICVKYKSYGVLHQKWALYTLHAQFICLSLIGCCCCCWGCRPKCAFTKPNTHVVEIKAENSSTAVDARRINDIRVSRTQHNHHRAQFNPIISEIEWGGHVTQLIRIWTNGHKRIVCVCVPAAGLWCVRELVDTERRQWQPKTQRYRNVIIIRNGYASTCPETQLNCAKWSVFTNWFALRKAQTSAETITTNFEIVCAWTEIWESMERSTRCSRVPLGTSSKCQVHTVRSDIDCFKFALTNCQRRLAWNAISSLH